MKLITQGVVGIVGDFSSDQSKQYAIISGVMKVPQCSFLSAAQELSDKRQYPLFYRVMGDADSKARTIMAFFMAMGWRRFAVIYEEPFSIGVTGAVAHVV